MRLYSFVNANYLKHVQHGLQTAHAVAELYNKYSDATIGDDFVKYTLLNFWARFHKTIIILDGGNCLDLHNIIEFFVKNDKDLRLPYSYFKEDANSLNNALTAVAVIVPSEIYDVKTEYSKKEEFISTIHPSFNYTYGGGQYYSLDNKEHVWKNAAYEEFYKLLKSKRLAQ